MKENLLLEHAFVSRARVRVGPSGNSELAHYGRLSSSLYRKRIHRNSDQISVTLGGTVRRTEPAQHAGEIGDIQNGRVARLTVIICTRNREREIVAAVESLIRQKRLPDELIVVDSGEGDSLETTLRESIAGRFPFVYERSSSGLPRQRNRGVALATGELLLFLDDDVILDEAYIGEITGFFERDTERRFHGAQGAITTKSLTAGGSYRWRGGLRRLAGGFVRKVFLLPGVADGKFKRSGFITIAGGDQPREIDFVAGGCMSFRREVFDEIAFDEHLTDYAWMEDLDISRQFKERGYRAYYWPHASLVHYVTPSSRTAPFDLGRMMARNQHYLFKKHSDGSWGDTAAFWWSCLGQVLWSFGRGDRRLAASYALEMWRIISRGNPLLGEGRT